ncbi:MAG: hypothetical protein ACRCU3_01935 [Eubacteriaceae bacterium]
MKNEFKNIVENYPDSKEVFEKLLEIGIEQKNTYLRLSYQLESEKMMETNSSDPIAFKLLILDIERINSEISFLISIISSIYNVRTSEIKMMLGLS